MKTQLEGRLISCSCCSFWINHRFPLFFGLPIVEKTTEVEKGLKVERQDCD